MRITTSKETFGKTTTTTFFADGVLVATMERRPEAFCSVKNGRRSVIRDTWKIANNVRWQYEAIKAVSPKFDFTIASPDLSWGYAGEILTKKGLEARLAAGLITTPTP